MSRRLAVAVLTALIAGCSTSGTSVLIGEGGARNATDPERIVLLLGPPQRQHEIVALVEGVAATDDYFTKPRTEAAALKAMKEEAARIGANAIVLTGKGVAPYGQSTISSTTANAHPAGAGFSAYSTTSSFALGFEKITFTGTAIRYTD